MSTPVADSSDIREAIRKAPAEPKQSCPMINAAIRAIRAASRDASHAVTKTDDASAARALADAAEALDDVENALEESRGTSAALRERAEALEKAGDLAVDAIEWFEEALEEARSAAETQEKVIQFLTARIQRSWWRRLLDHAQAAMWRTRARMTARRNADLRAEVFRLEYEHCDGVNELRPVARWLNDQEWTQSETGPFGERYCSECGAIWKGWAGTLPPEHDETCGLGRAARIVRRIIQREAE